MKEPKWTPGPWEFRFIYRLLRRVRESPGDLLIGHDSSEDSANAHLMAAAPKLAEFIESLLTKLRNDTWTEGDVAEGYMVLDEAKGIPFPGESSGN